MPGTEVSSGEFCRRLTQVQRDEVRHHLENGRGVAAYEDSRGRPAVVMTWGARDADVPGYPPAPYGDGTLSSWVPAPKSATPIRSPLMDRDQVPQIARPRVAPSYTEVPDVQFAMREGSHPRSRSGYITPGRYPVEAPEVAPQVQPQAPLSEEAAWWRDKLQG
jgi:hypothetical protein